LDIEFVTVEPLQIQGSKNHRPRDAGRVDGGIGQDQYGLAGDTAEVVVAGGKPTRAERTLKP
jgi:hypothetical protein